MGRTRKQQKGEIGEEQSIAEDIWLDNYEVERVETKNNKGYDYKRKKIKLW